MRLKILLTIIMVMSIMVMFVTDAKTEEKKAQSMLVNIQSVLSTDVNSAGQSTVFPQKNGHIIAAIYNVPPGATLPVHKHPFPRLGYVLAGALKVTNMQTSESQTYGPGAFVLECVDQWHEGGNPGTVPLRLLVVDLTEKGARRRS